LKIYVNRQPKLGPWGGGAKTVNKLSEMLLQDGHTVVYQLQEGIDVIFCFDPRPNSYGESINHLYAYKKAFPKTKIIQRVGDVGTHGKPELTNTVRQCLNKSDYFIFPSKWAMEYVDYSGDRCSVIYNCPMKEFYQNRNERTKLPTVPRIVTHHWSTNQKKGFDLYKQFDEFCQETGEFEFNYIGQVPAGYKFVNQNSPMPVSGLIETLPNYDIYLTASEEEAGANHVLESLAAGIPVVYRDTGGSIPEYCSLGGAEYSNFSTMIDSLRDVRDSYISYKKDCLKYSDTNDMVVEEYGKIIRRVYEG
jgi:glycosyltransferase involved in cell wall biosynthesis